MEKTATTNKYPTVQESVDFVKEMFSRVVTLANYGIASDDDTIDAFNLYSNLLDGILRSSVLLLSVEDQYEGDPISFHVFPFDSEDEAIKYGKQLADFTDCRIIDIDEFKTIAGDEWDTLNYYTTFDGRLCYRMRYKM